MSHTQKSTLTVTLLTIFRVVIGWHFLYEGLVKLFMPNWTAAGYLEVSNWIFAPVFHWMAANPSVLAVVDFLNIWGLILIGLSLMLGLFSRAGAVAGLVLMVFYYISNPPFVGLEFGVPTEGNYLVVNKNLVELFGLALVAFIPAARVIGLDRLMFKSMAAAEKGEKTAEKKIYGEPVSLPRRELVKSLATLPVLGVFAYAFYRKKKWQSWEEQNLIDAQTAASTKTLNLADLSDLKGTMPTGTIKGVEFSRLIMGGNLLSGWAHSRDLIYVSQLVKAYHHKDRIFATLLLAEKCGVNTLLTNPIMCTMLKEYWKRGIGKMQFISDCVGVNYTAQGRVSATYQEFVDRIQRAIDHGAIACYVQGETADQYLEDGRLDDIARALEHIRKQGVIAGIGAHHIETIKGCVDAGLDPDFWMKTLHHHKYWSAGHEKWHDNMYCFNPEETVRYMQTLKQPFIAFKTMAAGAIHPQEAFRYAFENGADFICAGMYDFQMVTDVNIALDAFNEMKGKRLWRA